MKKNLMIIMLLVSVLMVSLVSAGITSYTIKEGGEIGLSRIERIDTTTQKVQIDGEVYEQGETFTDPSGESFQIIKVEEPSWFLAKPKIEVEKTKEIWETVTCIFDDSNTGQKCYTDDLQFSCTGVEDCSVKVHSKTQKKLTWKSSCEGYAGTIIDGINEFARFSCGEETEECEQYTLQEGVSGITTLLGVNIDLKLFENAQEFWLNIDGDAELHAGGKTFTLSSGEIVTILEVNQNEGYIIIKVCPPKEEEPTTEGQCANLNCAWVFEQDEIGTATPKGSIKSVTANCGSGEIVFWGSCYSYGVSQQGVELYEEYVEAGADYTCGFRKTKDPPFDATLNAGALCCSPCS